MFGFKKKQNNQRTNVEKSTNVVSKKVHVSGYIFSKSEQLVSENRVQSPRGEGWLLVTTRGILFLLDSEGIYMNLKHEMINSFVLETKNKVSVSWKEDSEKFGYSFRIKDGEQEAMRIVHLANDTFHYKGSSTQQIVLTESEIEQVKKDYVARFQAFVDLDQKQIVELESKLDEIKNVDPNREKKKLELLTEINKTKENVRMHQKNIHYVSKMKIIRSYKIPKNIPHGNVWNDCYYDESRKAFVTFSKKFIEESARKHREIQRQFESEMGVNSGVIIPEERFEFKFGYPVLAGKDQDGEHVWRIVCTMTDDMLTEEIVMARLKPISHEESVIYDTVSEQWLGGDLKMCEKEYEIGHKNDIWRCTESLPEKIKWQKQMNASISND